MGMGSIIREARLAEGLTQAQLARRLDITQPSVARLEAAGDNVTVATLQRALNVMDRVLEIRSSPMPSSVDDALVASSLRFTPGERLEAYDANYDHMRAFANEIQPQVARARVA